MIGRVILARVGQARWCPTPQPATGPTIWSFWMREITSHVVNPANDKLKITVADEPGAGGANHLYMVEGFDTGSNASDPFTARHGAPSQHTTILFQNGPIPEKGVNGITQEVLLAIVADRLQAFQNGPYACAENGEALDHVLKAQEALLNRTRARMARGVEGTHTV